MLCLHRHKVKFTSVIVSLFYPIKVGISAQGKSHDLPIYVDREVWVSVISEVIYYHCLCTHARTQVMELHTCMLDRLYQDSVILHNRYILLLFVCALTHKQY